MGAANLCNHDSTPSWLRAAAALDRIEAVVIEACLLGALPWWRCEAILQQIDRQQQQADYESRDQLSWPAARESAA